MITRRSFVGMSVALASFAFSSAEAAGGRRRPPLIRPISSIPFTACCQRQRPISVAPSSPKAMPPERSISPNHSLPCGRKPTPIRPRGDIVIDFDPITNSQDPSVKSFAVTPEKLDNGTATIAVKMTTGYAEPSDNPADTVVRYDFVRDGGHWKNRRRSSEVVRWERDGERRRKEDPGGAGHRHP